MSEDGHLTRFRTSLRDLAAIWGAAFLNVLQPREIAEPLREAAVAGNLGEWTRLLTNAIIASCRQLGWPAAGKGHRLALLPRAQQEYLGIDVMAFPPGAGDGGPAWPFPLAVFELENQRERACYSLWKVLCVRAELRVVFAYRNDPEQVRQLVQQIKREVIDGYSIEQRQTLNDRTLLVTGTRGEGDTFPYGFFKIWRLNPNVGAFERFTNWG